MAAKAAIPLPFLPVLVDFSDDLSYLCLHQTALDTSRRTLPGRCRGRPVFLFILLKVSMLMKNLVNGWFKVWVVAVLLFGTVACESSDGEGNPSLAAPAIGQSEERCLRAQAGRKMKKRTLRRVSALCFVPLPLRHPAAPASVRLVGFLSVRVGPRFVPAGNRPSLSAFCRLPVRSHRQPPVPVGSCRPPPGISTCCRSGSGSCRTSGRQARRPLRRC